MKAADRWPLLDRVASTVHRRVTVIARDLATRPHDAASPPPAADPGIAVMQLTAADAAAYAAFRPGQGESTFRRRLERGARCFAVLEGGRLVHAGWSVLERAHAPYLDRDLILDAGDVYLFDVYTLPGRRLGELGALRSEHVRRFYEALRCRRSIAIVAPENAGGSRFIAALGYRPIGSYDYWRLGPLRRWRSETVGDEPIPALAEPSPSAGAGESA